MTNHPNRSQIINLDPIKPSLLLQEKIDIEVTGAVCFEQFQVQESMREHWQKIDKHVAMLRLNGKRYHVSVMRVMLDEDRQLKSTFEKAVIADAVRQAVVKQYPDRKWVEVEISPLDGNDGYFEYNAHIWWNHRKQYELCICSISY